MSPLEAAGMIAGVVGWVGLALVAGVAVLVIVDELTAPSEADR